MVYTIREHWVCTNCCLKVYRKMLLSEADMRAYKCICIQTNAHKRSYNPDGQVNRNPKPEKYKRIIQNLFPPKKNDHLLG